MNYKEVEDQLEKVLYDQENGLLIKYHFEKGIDDDALDSLYSILELLKDEWKTTDLVPKKIMYKLVGIIPGLYMDLPIYSEKDEFEEYEETIQNLEIAITMCFNPNIEDPNFETPLRDLC